MHWRKRGDIYIPESENSSKALENRVLYVGIDESNHGKFPEVFVSVFSNLEKDIEKQPYIPKSRNHNKLFGKFSKRDYSFLLVSENDHKRIPKYEFMGVVTASLIKDKVGRDIENLLIYLDGEIGQTKQFFIKYLVSKTCNIEIKRIHVKSGAGMDTKYKIVNIADQMAHYLFREAPPKKISENKHRRYLIR